MVCIAAPTFPRFAPLLVSCPGSPRGTCHTIPLRSFMPLCKLEVPWCSFGPTSCGRETPAVNLPTRVRSQAAGIPPRVTYSRAPPPLASRSRYMKICHAFHEIISFDWRFRRGARIHSIGWSTLLFMTSSRPFTLRQRLAGGQGWLPADTHQPSSVFPPIFKQVCKT